jgi:hypothetical protein
MLNNTNELESILSGFLTTKKVSKWVKFANKFSKKIPTSPTFLDTLWLILFHPEAPEESGAETMSLFYEYASDFSKNITMRLVWIQQAAQKSINNISAYEDSPLTYKKALIHHKRIMDKMSVRQIEFDEFSV